MNCALGLKERTDVEVLRDPGRNTHTGYVLYKHDEVEMQEEIMQQISSNSPLLFSTAKA